MKSTQTVLAEGGIWYREYHFPWKNKCKEPDEETVTPARTREVEGPSLFVESHLTKLC